MKMKHRNCISGVFVLLLVLGAMLGMLCLGTMTAFAEVTPAFKVVWSEVPESVYGDDLREVTARYFDGDGQEYTATVSGFPALGDGEHLAVGTYDLTAVPADPMHALTNDTITYTVMPKEVAVVWEGDYTVAYGTTPNVSAHYVDADGAKVFLDISGLAVGEGVRMNAGEHPLSVTASDPNYNVSNLTATYTVTPKEVAVVWEGDYTVAYGTTPNVSAHYVDADGAKVFLDISGLVMGVRMNAGEHPLSVTASDPNYNVSNLTATYTVTPKEVAVVWEGDYTVAYGTTPNVSAHYVDADGAKVFLDISGLVMGEGVRMNAGEHPLSVTASDPNYNVSNLTATYTVTPKEVTVVWGGNPEITYGDAITATAYYLNADGEEVPLTVYGIPEAPAEGYLNAGYYALAVYNINPNYTVKNPTAVYRVKPMEVEVQWSGVFSHVYGENAGHITAIYAGDIEATITDLPDHTANAGRFVLTAVPKDGNYIFTNSTVNYTVYPKAVNVVWSGELASDHGAPVAELTASCKDGNVDIPVTIEGMPANGADAGGYVVTATIANGNYVLRNATVVYVVRDMQVINGLKEENAQLKGQNSILREQNEALQDKITALETQVGTLSGKIGTLTNEIGALRTQNNTLSTKVNTLQTKINELTAEIIALEADTAALTEEIGTMGERIEVLESENGKLKQAVETLQAKLDAATGEITALREKAVALTGEVQELQTQTMLLQVGIGELKEQDKLKVVAIIILAAALLMAIASIVFYFYRKYLMRGTVTVGGRTGMTDEECRSVGAGLHDAIQRGQDICEDIIARNRFSAEYSGAVRGQFRGWEKMVVGAMQDYVPEVGAPFDRYSMVDVTPEDRRGNYVTKVLAPGKRMGNFVVINAQVITDETFKGGDR